MGYSAPMNRAAEQIGADMLEEILIAGFGGQGVIFAGRLLCEAAMLDGKQVACSVSYGPEMRGGTANCSAIISDEPIGSLVVTHPTVAVVMNEPSMARFEPRVRSGGILIVNESLVPYKSTRVNIKGLYIPATGMAAQLGNRAVANLILVGSLLAVKPLASEIAVRASLEKMLGKARLGLMPMNEEALRVGKNRIEAMNLASMS